MRRLIALMFGVSWLAAVRVEAATVGPVHNPANGHDYYVNEDLMTWAAAEAWAVALGGHLVAIDGSAENAWVAGSLALQDDLYWIGARDDANTTDAVFEWTTGEGFAYTNWLPGEPDDNAGFGGSGDFVALSRNTSTWSDRNGQIEFFGGIAEVVPTVAVEPGASTAGDIRLVVPSLASHDGVTMWFDLPQAMTVRVRVFDVSGRLVRTLTDGALGAGRHDLAWNTQDERSRRVGSGVYFVSLEAREARCTARVVVIR